MDRDFYWYLVGLLVGLFCGGCVAACCMADVNLKSGEEWGECYPNSTCNADMVCHRERCVVPMEMEVR